MVFPGDPRDFIVHGIPAVQMHEHDRFRALTDLLLNADRIARMKPGVILVNTARGALVDEEALLAALRSGHIRHAGLDVFHNEPLKGDHPLTQIENVTLSAHAAQAPASSRHSAVAAARSTVNVTVASVAVVSNRGEEVIGTPGVIGSAIQSYTSGVGSTCPSTSTLRTSKWCGPSETVSSTGSGQPNQSPPSSRHSELATSSPSSDSQ